MYAMGGSVNENENGLMQPAYNAGDSYFRTVEIGDGVAATELTTSCSPDVYN